MQSDPNWKRVTLACGVMLGIACLCLCAATLIGGGVVMLLPETLPLGLDAIAPEAPIAPDGPTPSTAEAVPAPQSGEDQLAPDILAQMDQIQAEVSQLRGFPIGQPVSRALLTPDQLRQSLVEDFDQEYTPEDARQDAVVLAAFGLLEPGFDLRQYQIDLLTEQVAGFYDDDEKAMYVIQGAEFGGVERMTYAHEFVHALQDQQFNFKDGLRFDTEPCKQDSERCAALQALIEGDATLAQLQWFGEYATNQDRLDLLTFSSDNASPVFDHAPEFLKQDLLFPYTQGQIFVQTLFDDGGWAAVNEAYRNPPLSTEQILHPADYPADRPVPVALPDLGAALGPEWEELDQGVMGEWYLQLILAYGWLDEARISIQTAQRAAEGWAGDAYIVFARGRETALAMLTLWESPADAREFAEAFDLYAAARYGQATQPRSWEMPAGTVHFRLDGDRTLWIAAPDAALQQIEKALKP